MTQAVLSCGMRVWLGLILVVFVGWYGRALDHDYVWDDFHGVRDNPTYDEPLIESLIRTEHDHIDPNLRQLNGTRPAHDSYRPLLHLSYHLSHGLLGRSGRAQHIFDTFVAMLSVLVFWFVARRWLGDDAPALVATAVFAFHPLAIEPIVYLSARGDLLAGLFALVCTLCAFHADGPKRWYWTAASALAFLASLFCKEAALGLPLALLGIFMARRELRQKWVPLVALFSTLPVYVAVRLAVAGSGGTAQGLETAAAFPGIWTHYLRVATLPNELSTGRLYDGSFLWVGWALAAGCAGLVALAWRRRHSESEGQRWLRIALSAVFWFAALIGPAAVVVIIMGEVADRYAYLPLAGFAVLVGTAFGAARSLRLRVRQIVYACLGVWALLCMVIGWLQLPTWQNNRTLYAHAIAMAPDSGRAHFRFGFVLARDGAFEGSIPYFVKAIELNPRDETARNNLGVAYMNTGRLEEALGAFEGSLEASGGMHFRAWYNLGLTKIKLERIGEGCTDVAKSLRINTQYRAAQQLWAEACQPRLRPPE